jgi:O-antigen/teichoic acid export membrane protein
MSKGILYYLLSRAVFLLGAYAIHIYIARFLGPEQYGVFGICLSIITICYVFLGNGVKQIVAKSTAKYRDNAKYFLKVGAAIQLVISFSLGLLLVAFSRNIAQIFREPELPKLLLISGAIIISHSLFFVYTGVLNGLKRFGAENAVDGVHGFVRAAAAILLVYFGYEIAGALLGLLIGSVLAVILAFLLTLNLSVQVHSSIRMKDIFKGAIPIMIIFGSLIAMMNIDLLAVKYFIKDGQYTGYYTSATAISRIVFWIIVAYSGILLPYVSVSFHKNDLAEAKRKVSQILRYTFLSITPGVLLVSFWANDVVRVIYGENYQAAGDALRILVWGLFGLGFLSIISVIMIGIDQERKMSFYGLGGIFLAFVLNVLLVPRFGLVGAAISTSVSALFLSVLSFGFIKKRLQLRLSWPSVGRLLFGGGMLAFGACVLKESHLNFFIGWLVLYAGYIFLLVLAKELGQDDLRILQNLLASILRKPGSST